MSFKAQFDAGSDRWVRQIAPHNLPEWMALMNVYPTSFPVNYFFALFFDPYAGQPISRN
jgi:antibiotic biosynthesis monooxygenase (ABM) superfamily enzyme